MAVWITALIPAIVPFFALDPAYRDQPLGRWTAMYALFLGAMSAAERGRRPWGVFVAAQIGAALGATLALAIGGERRPLLGLLGLYAAAAAVSARRVARQPGLLHSTAVALTFPCMHLTWGVSLLRELLRPPDAATLGPTALKDPAGERL